MVAAGLDYWEGESPGPFTGVTEAERLDAVKLAIELGNDVNAHAVFGMRRCDGEIAQGSASARCTNSRPRLRRAVLFVPSRPCPRPRSSR
jgi:hypothetical protein